MLVTRLLRPLGSIAALVALTTLSTGMGGCSSEVDEDGGEGAELGDGELGQSPDAVRESSPGPIVKSTDAEVWSVTNQWADRDTADARKAGIAWAEKSGLSWEEKYQKWIDGFERIDNGWSKTIRFTTPYGRQLDAPVLECADFAIWLRVTFASFYHLPFFMTGWRNGRAIYIGHMGVVDASGNPVTGFTRYKKQYTDYETRWKAGTTWPSDSRLRAKHVGPDDDTSDVKIDGVGLPAGSGDGAYYDELFLNKRVGHLLVLLDGYFGSVNLADGANMFHITPESIGPGDVLLERWQKEGIGHALPVMTVTELGPPLRLQVSTASGSMPRRQPLWETPSQSASYFKSDITGGEGLAADGTPFAKLGGGIRRWRVSTNQGGRWVNVVPTASREVWIGDDKLDDIAARPARFSELLGEATPEAARDAALATIEAARETLRDRPASCSSRTKREDAFEGLYEVMQTSFGKTRAQVDAQYRTLEDYVFAELEYTTSKTCCWNTTTTAMGEIVLDYAKKQQTKDAAAGVCKQPEAFRAIDGGYDLWKQHAASLGRSADWRAWSEDEPCAQRAIEDDSTSARGDVGMCR